MIFKSPYEEAVIPLSPLPELVLRYAASQPDKPALIDGPSGRTITYGQLAEGIRKVAKSLHLRGLQKGDVLAIYSPNLPEYALAFHGTASLGGVVTTANPLYTPEELAFQLKDSGAKFLVTVPAFLAKAQTAAQMAGGVQEIFVFGQAEGATPFSDLLNSDGILPPVQIDPQKDLIVLPYSSGTTGYPKGVMLTHYNLVANLCQMEGVIDFGQDDVMIGILPFFHIYGMVVVMGYMLYVGGTVVSLPAFELEGFLKTLQAYQVTRACLVPPIILALAKHPAVDQYDLKHLKQIFSGAAPLSADLQQAVMNRLKVLTVQGYGLTETSPVTHATPNDPAKVKAGSVGPNLRSTEVKIVDSEGGRELGVGEDGEVWIRGPQVMQGYLNNPEATAATIDAEGWLHTGDIGHMDADGYLFIVDRLKELIKYKGYQVAPAVLEGLLLQHPAVADAAVIPVPDEEAGELPKAYVVLKAGQALEAEALMAFVAEHVSPQEKIRLVEFTDIIPKSASGKILRRLLKDRERARLAGDA